MKLFILFLFFLQITNYEIKSQSLTFENVFEKVGEIKLSSEKEALMVHISFIKVFIENYLIISSIPDNKVRVFDKKGKFLKLLGNKGQGPNEYLDPRSINCDNEFIYIHDLSQNKIVKYNKKFEYAEDFKIKLAYSNILVKNGCIFMSSNTVKDIKYYMYSTKGQLLKEFNTEEKVQDINFYTLELYGLTVDGDNSIYHCGLRSFILRKFDNNYSFIKSIKITQKPQIVLSGGKRDETYIENFFYLDDYLFAEYIRYERLKLVDLSLLVFDKNLSYRNEINIKNNSGKYIHMLPSNGYLICIPVEHNDNIDNPKLVLYKFKGLK